MIIYSKLHCLRDTVAGVRSVGTRLGFPTFERVFSRFRYLPGIWNSVSWSAENCLFFDSKTFRPFQRGTPSFDRQAERVDPYPQGRLDPLLRAPLARPVLPDVPRVLPPRPAELPYRSGFLWVSLSGKYNALPGVRLLPPHFLLPGILHKKVAVHFRCLHDARHQVRVEGHQPRPAEGRPPPVAALLRVAGCRHGVLYLQDEHR